MSAGTGIYHSEFNKNHNEAVKFLQIWLFPNQKNVQPRYDQISLQTVRKKNELYQILSPHANDQGVWIHQNAWFFMGDFDQETEQEYSLHDTRNGLYTFVLEGAVQIDDQKLSKRDGYGVWSTSKVKLKATKAKVLLMEVPMYL